MKKLKFYVNNLEELNEEEKRTNKISYNRLIKRIGDIWLFNNAPQLSNYDFEYEVNSDYDEDKDEYIDIYQYYLIDINDYMIEKLNNLNCKDVIIAYSLTLDQYILMVDHCGTSWDYVMTSLEPTTNYQEADL